MNDAFAHLHNNNLAFSSAYTEHAVGDAAIAMTEQTCTGMTQPACREPEWAMKQQQQSTSPSLVTAT